MNKKLIGLFAALIMVTGIAAPAHAAGLTSSQVSAIIGLLRSFGADSSVISNVQVALGGTATSESNQAFCHTFGNDLTVGSRGSDVSALNQALASSGIDISNNGASFDENVAADVVTFQTKYGIRQTGYVGPMTRAKLNSLYKCGYVTYSPMPVITSTPIVTPTPTPVEPTISTSNAYTLVWTAASATAPAPTITEISSKGQSAGYVVAGKTAYVTGTGLGNGKTLITIDGNSILTAPSSDTLVTFTTPTFPTYPAMLNVSVTNSAGLTSSTYSLTVSAPPAPTITMIGAKDPNPTTGAVLIAWQTSAVANVSLDMICTPGSISFTTDKGNAPTCEKGGVWYWQNQNNGSVLVTPSGNTTLITVPLTLTVYNPNGTPTNQKQTLYVTFPRII